MLMDGISETEAADVTLLQPRTLLDSLETLHTSRLSYASLSHNMYPSCRVHPIKYYIMIFPIMAILTWVPIL
jgi:hypothetical protein